MLRNGEQKEVLCSHKLSQEVRKGRTVLNQLSGCSALANLSFRVADRSRTRSRIAMGKVANVVVSDHERKNTNFGKGLPAVRDTCSWEKLAGHRLAHPAPKRIVTEQRLVIVSPLRPPRKQPG